MRAPSPPRPGTAARPFRPRLAGVAAYPLQGDALLMLLVLTAAGLLAWLPGIGGLLSLLVYFCGYHYAFEILLASANGRDASPARILHAPAGAVWRLLGLLLALLVLVRLGLAAGQAWLVVSAIALLALLQPGILAALAHDEGLASALNPAVAVRMAQRIGAAYWLVALILFAGQVLVVLAARALVTVVPGVVAAVCVDALFYWSVFAAFRLLGETLYRFHGELGFAPAADADAPPSPHDRDRALLERAGACDDAGDAAGAIALLGDEIRSRAVTPALHEQYRRLLRGAGDAAALDAHAGLFLAALAEEQDARRALPLLREALDANPALRLDPAHGGWLARRALERGQLQLAVDAWCALLREHPRHPDAPRWALQAAALLHERFGEPARARALLAGVREACRDEADAAQLDAALAVLPAPGPLR